MAVRLPSRCLVCELVIALMCLEDKADGPILNFSPLICCEEAGKFAPHFPHWAVTLKGWILHVFFG
jgi:hypothetical protein